MRKSIPGGTSRERFALDVFIRLGVDDELILKELRSSSGGVGGRGELAPLYLLFNSNSCPSLPIIAGSSDNFS